jgi:capsular polysaccharide transport system permease protein
MRIGLRPARPDDTSPSAGSGRPDQQAIVPAGGAMVTTTTTLAPAGDGLHRLPSPRPMRLLGPPRQSLRVVSFVAVVLMPVAIVAAYFFAVAADQYVAEFRFTLSTIEPPRLDPLSLLAGNAAPSPVAVESQILVQYIASRAMVDEADAALDLRRLFSPPQADWWARPPQPATVEELVYYWKGQVDPFYDPASGAVAVRVRAFAPADALRLAQTIVAACERLVNELSARARRDALHHAEAVLVQAESRLKSALAEIRAFRDREGLIDPARTAETTGLLSARLRDDLVRAKADLATLKTYMRDDAPTVKVLKARIRSLEAQRTSLAREMTDPDATRSDTLSRVLGSYEQLESERKFAEASYQLALRGLDQARANADRQRVFIASFVPPRLPEEALYPRRWRTLGTAALIAFALWAIGGLAVQSVRDHLA